MKGCLLLLALVAVVFGQPRNAVRFQSVDLFINSGVEPLAAYQLEFAARTQPVRIVGVEGGDAAPFKQAPHYDPKAIQRDRVIIAAFSTDPAPSLPKGKTRIATIHLQVSSELPPEFTLKLETAANSAGRRIQAEATFELRKEP